MLVCIAGLLSDVAVGGGGGGAGGGVGGGGGAVAAGAASRSPRGPGRTGAGSALAPADRVIQERKLSAPRQSDFKDENEIGVFGSHPDVQEKVAEELQAIFQGSDRPPSMQDLAEMKYLERVIKETLRLYPSVPFIARHLNEDLQVGKYSLFAAPLRPTGEFETSGRFTRSGYRLPAGCNVAIRIYLVHRNPEYFPEPDKFNPDHFLPERVQGRHPYAYIPFSAGSRNCIGQKFAMLEEKAVLSTLLRRYSFRAVDKQEDLKLLSELVLRPSNGIRIKIQRRHQYQKSA
ncbi:Uncharacterized protein GBIM_14763 [Gryllus bimaculatus]|nr:Uncharacterized protein GBIM_14763 [Gryllus bimaculatus]